MIEEKLRTGGSQCNLLNENGIFQEKLVAEPKYTWSPHYLDKD